MTWFTQSRIWVVCALLMGIGEAAAEYRFDVWTAESGLPQNTVRDIVQTRDGYLWVATMDGLARFDGVRFTVFNKANTPSLSSNRILALYEDHEGDLWIGLYDGGLVRHHSGRFIKCGTAPGLPGAVIHMISGDELGNLWVTGEELLQWKDGRFQPAVPENSPIFLQDDQSRDFQAGSFWNTNQAGLHIFSRGKLTTLGASSGLPSLRIHYVDQDQHGNWWLATDDAGLVKVRDGKVLKTFTTQDGLPRNTVNSKASWLFACVALEDRKGNVWVNGAGPWLGRLKNGVFTAYPSADATTSPQPLLTPGSAGHQINKFFEDREGHLWIGTEASGLIRAREQVINMVSTRQGLQAANIYPVLEDRMGAVWLGTWDLGLARVNGGAVTNFSVGFPNNLATAFCQDRAGRLWVGTFAGVYIFEGDKFSLSGVPASFVRKSSVHAICEDHNGVLWFGAASGLFRYENGELTLHEKTEVPEGIMVIIEDRGRSLWIGSGSGLTRLSNGHFNTWTERDGLPSNNVRALYEDGDGILWIGTGEGGLARFKEGRFTRYTTTEGMFDNGVFQILEDASGNFWMSSNRGIHRVNKRELNEFAEGRRRSITAVAYGKRDGMLNPECNGGHWPAGAKTRDGKLWFPTQDGVAVIDPATLSTNPKPPPVVIESFLLEREPQALESAVRVPPRKSNIEIQYTGLSLVNSERLRFKYRLAGAEHDWVEAGTRRTAHYSHLAPGHYTFTVLAANSDGLWNDVGTSLAFTVLPAWHQTAWFRGLAVLAIVGGAVGFYRRRISRLEAQRAAQQNFSRRLIESQEQERKRIAAELHDGLGQHLLVIKNRAAMWLKATAATAPEQVNEITRAATQALEEVREISQNLRPYQLDRLGLTRALHGLVKKVSASSNLKCVADIAPLDGVFQPEAEINLYRIVQEGLNNILKHSGATEARMMVERDEARVRLQIEDNGRGFDPHAVHTDPERAGSMGLSGIAERIRILGGRLDVQSSPGGGTRLKIELPLPAEKKN